MSTTSALLSPTILVHQRYRIVRPIGQGGFGAVYEAIDQRLGSTVALKQTIHRDPQRDHAFAREAQLLAGLRHPALPRVSDYFADPRGLFLVMDFIPGDDLLALLLQRGEPFLVDEVLDWADQLLAALTFLHQQAPPIIHRDIKPQNLKLTPQGEIILLDFGLARGRVPDLLTTPGYIQAINAASALISPSTAPSTRHATTVRLPDPDEPSLHAFTPAYAPPEQIAGLPTDARSDLYALAATLYTLLTGAPPASAQTRTAILQQTMHDPLEELQQINPQVPNAISAVIGQTLALDAAARPPSAIALREALQQARAALMVVYSAVAIPNCPYPGLLPFGEADQARFFGREREVQELLTRLHTHALQTVIGPSGSGKSSLVFAGLLPALRTSTLFGAREWMVRTMRPGAAPLATLRKLLSAAGTATRDRQLLLIVDQLEELFTLGRTAAESFQQLLQQVAETPYCSVVLTVRADFYPDLMAAPLWPIIRVQRVEVAPLDAAGLRQAIIRPAQAVGVAVETALIERLVSDAAGEPGVLPLVQEALVVLWDQIERRPLPGGGATLVLTLAAYEALGQAGYSGLQVALARRADSALTVLSPEQQAIARRIFLRLVQFGSGQADTRRQQTETALHSADDDPDQFAGTLRHLAEQRLLVLGGAPDGTRTVDLAHDALVRGWPTLHIWLRERRAAEQTRRRLTRRAAEWEQLGRGKGGLLDEATLPEAARWLESPDAADLGYDAALADLVQASRRALTEQARQQRQRQHLTMAAAVVFAVLALLALGAAWWALDRQHLAEKQAAIATSRQLAVQAINLADNERFDLALLLAQEALQTDTTFEARAALISALRDSHPISYHLHQAETTSVAFSPDGTTLASASQNGSIMLWDVATGQPRGEPLRGHTSEVGSIVFSPDGTTLASGGGDFTVILWDVATGQPRGAPLRGHTREIGSIAFSPDSQTLASGGWDFTIILWDAATGQRRGTPLRGHTDRISSIAFSPDGTTLASGSSDSTIILWDVATGQPLKTLLEGHTSGVTSVAFSPDGTTLASGGTDTTTILWDVATGQARRPPLQGHTASVTSVAFSPDGTTLASGSSDSTIILWNAASGHARGTPLEGHTAGITSVAFSPDGTTLASGSSDKIIILWDMATEQPLSTPLEGHTAAVTSATFSPDSTTLASGSTDTTVILWDVAIGQTRDQLLHEGRAEVASVAFSPNGQTLAAGRVDGTITLWDGATGQPIGRPLRGHTREVSSLAFSPDGTTLASGSFDETIILWDVATRQSPGIPLRGHNDLVTSVAFSPDGQTLASGSTDSTIFLWDMATRQPSGGSLRGHTREVSSLAFSPDGTTLASGSGDTTIILWSLGVEGTPPTPLRGHTHEVTSVAFSPDGQTLASGSVGGAIILWDRATEQSLIEPLRGHAAAITSVAFSPDGQTLASGSADQAIRLWAISIETWRAHACRIANRNLTWEEWQRYLPNRTYAQTCPALPPPGDLPHARLPVTP